MNLINAEGKIIGIVERSDIQADKGAVYKSIDFLIVPLILKDDFLESHFVRVLKSVKRNNVYYI